MQGDPQKLFGHNQIDTLPINIHSNIKLNIKVLEVDKYIETIALQQQNVTLNWTCCTENDILIGYTNWLINLNNFH